MLVGMGHRQLWFVRKSVILWKERRELVKRGMCRYIKRHMALELGGN